MKPITVLIVDDSALIREIFKEILSAESDIQVLDTACDPYDAREKIKRLNPDVITLDVEMPKMDGLSFLEKVMSLRPMPVIMASTLTQKGAEVTIRALELGAFDYISKPVASQTRATLEVLKEELVEKVRAAAKAHTIKNRTSILAQKRDVVLEFHPVGQCHDIIAIGASTGGVEALRDIFLQLPKNAPPIVVAQHMPENFTRSFADRLNTLSQVVVSEAKHNDPLKSGYAYIAPGGLHMKIVKQNNSYVCKLEDGPAVSCHKPSVDVLFHSVAQCVGAKSVGVILTGMGRDGAEGLRAMRDAGAYTIGQNQASCVVYGMPQMAQKAGAVHIELSLNDIPAAILRYCEHHRMIS
jgi:two-component system chemotaxis response regulator CheB